MTPVTQAVAILLLGFALASVVLWAITPADMATGLVGLWLG